MNKDNTFALVETREKLTALTEMFEGFLLNQIEDKSEVDPVYSAYITLRAELRAQIRQLEKPPE